MDLAEPARTLLAESTPHGEVVVRRRGAVTELIVGGVFAMDTVDTTTEVLLAERALACHASPRRVLVGGLGLGVTTRAVLADPRVDRVDVVEIAEPLVRWARQGAMPELVDLDGGRCALHVADVADVLAGDVGPSGPWDVVLLDVDNGPGFLVGAHNADLYRPAGLLVARLALATGGILTVWSSHRSRELLAAMRTVAGSQDEVTEEVVATRRGQRTFDYALYTLQQATG
ncbi:MAG: hypothetical protein ACRCYR_20490 [Phycicoccus sp.]